MIVDFKSGVSLEGLDKEMHYKDMHSFQTRFSLELD